MFTINNIKWQIIFVPQDSKYLIDRSGNKTLATTDPVTKVVYISNVLRNNDRLLRIVVIHEVVHCVLVSYNLLDDIYRMAPEHNIEMEEFICNFVSVYLDRINDIIKNK